MLVVLQYSSTLSNGMVDPPSMMIVNNTMSRVVVTR